ncbi:MAG: hypothetical protein ACTSQI_18190 [Candidatus Helarchaeota archaeon]
MAEPLPVTPAPDKPKVRLGDKDKKRYKERLALVYPLINEFGAEATKPTIRQFCIENNLPFNKTYKFYLLWKKEGKEGLKPKRARKHKKSHLDPRVEALLQEALYDYNPGEWVQITAAYDEFAEKCRNAGLKPASYETFRIRIGDLPASEQIGQHRPPTQSVIKRGLTATYQEGRYPAAVIQMDHTKLDIWVVDAFTNQPLGRPWCTIGIDVFSRAT